MSGNPRTGLAGRRDLCQTQQDRSSQPRRSQKAEPLGFAEMSEVSEYFHGASSEPASEMSKLSPDLYSTVSLDDPGLAAKLDEWQFYYNWHRPHGALNGKAPIDRYCELRSKTPLGDEVEALYDPSRERIQEQNYRRDLELRKLKRCL